VREHEVARRYAEALYQVAAEQNAIESTETELRTVATGAADVPRFRQFLAHPLISRERKTALLREAFPKISDRTKNLLELLIRNRRETYLDLVYDEYVAVRVAAEGLTRVAVTTARPLDDDQRRRLAEKLEEALHRRVLLEESVDERLLGGARIEMDGRVIDGTLRARLEKLRAALGE
jgi:F-type H+-transporting ATPase subunit delta